MLYKERRYSHKIIYYVLCFSMFIQSDKYAKGLLSLDTLETGVDCILAIGCYTLEALAVLVACLSIGVSVLVGLTSFLTLFTWLVIHLRFCFCLSQNCNIY